ncbi:hypothetical protein Mal4_16680 [Maioricimonas rarisocia]|uniref:Uncharacterized protein n=1 Tax=Maioricimonas rarisocia TaxID=2528026 RepID=A0A517Z4K0_9PLAN|nr:hypothetical protein [Maioricimonas rarisocia]QDU37357.1 hypothetical protein Mal4_16680 [Maioricimonas rarisocia]
MRMTALTCPHCAAPLDLPARVQRARCDYCGSQLLLSHGNVVEHDAGPARSAPQDDAVVRELDQLDREWQAYRRTYLPRDSEGQYFVPDPEHCLYGAWGTGVIGAIPSGTFLAMNLLTAAIASAMLTASIIFVLNRQRQIGQVYQRSLANYQQERLKILNAAGT